MKKYLLPVVMAAGMAISSPVAAKDVFGSAATTKLTTQETQKVAGTGNTAAYYGYLGQYYSSRAVYYGALANYYNYYTSSNSGSSTARTYYYYAYTNANAARNYYYYAYYYYYT